MATRVKKIKRQQRRKEQNAERRRKSKVLHISNASANEILIFGVIDQWEVSAKDVNDAVVALGNQPEITVRINSGGGDVFEGFAIYNLLAQHQARIIINIEGAALSIASVIAMAGDEIRMAQNALFMVHDPSAFAIGTSKDMRQEAELLEKASAQIRDTYAARTGIEPAEIAKMMEDETWLTAEEALEQGFITEVVEAKKVAANFDTEKFSIPDRLAKLVASYSVEASGDPPEPKKKVGIVMNEALRKLCVKFGMDEKLSDEDATKWMSENAEKLNDGIEPVKAVPPVDKKTKTPVTPPVTPVPKVNVDDVVTTVTDLLDKRDKERAEAKVKFVAEVDANLELAFGANVPEAIAAKCHNSPDIDAVRKTIKDYRASHASDDLNVVFSNQQPRDRHISDVGTAFRLRAMQNAGCSEASIDKAIPKDTRGKDWKDFAGVTLLAMARECLLIDGVNPRAISRLSNPDIAKAAFGFANATALRNEAIHVTGTLGDITMDAINKTLTAGYEEAPSTWRGPMRQASSVPDFKNINRIRLGAVPNLPIWPDNVPADEARMNDEKVTYAVEARAEKVAFSWRLFVNDDMDALSRIPKLMGDAAARTVNATAWAQVTGNPTMSYDSVALFSAVTGNRKKKNLSTGAGAPATSTVNTLSALMRLMTGVNTPEESAGDDILNITPTYLVAPAVLEGTVLSLVRSIADPADNKSSGVYNTAGYLTPVIEPLLDGNSSTAWYLFADPSRVDTVEVTFLQGQETPATYDWIDNETLSRNVMIVQTFEAKAIDHRGIQKHAGA